MLITVLILLVGVVMIDGKLWRMMGEQKRHHIEVEQLLSEIHQRMKSEA